MTTPYRDDREALRGRLASLESELGRVREALEALDDQQRAAAAIEKEIAAVRAQLEDRNQLEDLRIAAPCSADWNAMLGDNRVRFCDTCQKNVYDLSKLSRAEAERLVAANEGPPPCVRLYKRRDGTVITNDCPVGRKRRRLRRIVAAGVGGTLLAAGALLRWRMNTVRTFQGSVGSAAPDEIASGALVPVTPVEEEFTVTSGMVSHESPAAKPPPVTGNDREWRPPRVTVAIRDVAFAGFDDAANARRVLHGMEAGFRRCARRAGPDAEGPDATAPLRDGATVRMHIELDSNGEVTSVTPGLAAIPPPTVDCMKARIEAAQFAPTNRGKATIDVKLEVHLGESGDVRGKQAP